jgi:hypothetical protein
MLDRDAISLIKQYLDFLKDTLDETPIKQLYRLFNGKVGPYDYTTETQGMFSKVLGVIFKRHSGPSLIDEHDSPHRQIEFYPIT